MCTVSVQCALLERHFHGVLKMALKVSFYSQTELPDVDTQTGELLNGQKAKYKIQMRHFQDLFQQCDLFGVI